MYFRAHIGGHRIRKSCLSGPSHVFFYEKDLIMSLYEEKKKQLILLDLSIQLLATVAVFLLFVIIPFPHHYAYFEQFDWLEKKFYTSINSTSVNLETSFLPHARNMCSNIDIDKILMTKLDKKKLSFLWILSMCKLRRITHKLNINPFGLYSVCV